MSRLVLLFAVLASVGAASAQEWEVVWSDEFDTDGAPDPARWNYDIGGNGWGNQESQLYTNRRENSRVENGVLVIEARKETLGGNEYTSARLVTRDRASWTYGRMEARIKLPVGQGIWPAFWMLAEDSPYGGWPTSGEIDIMEYLGHQPSRVHGTLHYGGVTYAPCRGNRGAVQGHCFTGTSYTLPTGAFPDDFHVFAVEWEPTEIRWYVDDVLYQTQTYWYSGAAPFPAPYDQPFHLLLNVAVGGQWPGYPDETTVFPQRMEIDYVRVFRDASLYPEVSFSGPEDGASLAAGATVALAATASEGARVEFVQGDGVLGVDTEPPYELRVAGLVDGCYALGARAINEAGYASETERVAITVGAGCPEGSRAPYLMVPASIPGIVEAEDYDLGGADVAYRDFTDTNDPGSIRQSEGVDIRASGDVGGGHDVTRLAAREWITYTVDVAEAGMYQITARVAGVNGGSFRLSLDGEDLMGTIDVAATGSESVYADAVLGEVALPAGRHLLRLDARSAGYSLNRLSFTLAGATATDGKETGSLDLRLAPNPTADRVEVTYQLATAGRVDVSVFDTLGRRVAVLASGPQSAGPHQARFDVDALPPGVYVCRLTTESGQQSAQLSVVR